MIFIPVALAVILRRRFTAAWWLFCIGMVTFTGSQVVHIPLNNWLAGIGLLDNSAREGWVLVQMSFILGLTAGLCEELARAVGYWFLFRRRQAAHWQDGVMVGLGHGGIESMVFGGVMTAASVTSLWGLRGTDLATLNLPAEQLAAVEQQLALFLASPWMAFAPLAERIAAMALHVGLSMMVWLAFKRRHGGYVVLAIVVHLLFDAVWVYLRVGGFIENIWLIEGLFILVAFPFIFWVWRMRPPAPAKPARPTAALGEEMALFATAVGKELLQQWRTKRVLVVTAVFVAFGLLSPLAAHFMPQILSSVEGAEQFADLIPTPTTADALDQYLRNLTQFGFIIAVLVGMGAVAGEKERGTAAMILSKPLPRWAFILSKFVAQALVYLLAFALAAVAAYYYTLILFDGLALAPFFFGNFLLLVWLLTYVAVTLLGSTLTRTIGAAAGAALAGAVVLLLAGQLPNVGMLAPAGLVAWAAQLGLDTAVAANGGALAMGVVLIVVCLVTAVAAFEVQEL